MEKDPADNPWNFGPESLFYDGGPFALAPKLQDLPEALRGFVSMTCLQFYMWAQALTRLFERGADVRVRVLCGDICEAAGGSPERAAGGSPAHAPTPTEAPGNSAPGTVTETPLLAPTQTPPAAGRTGKGSPKDDPTTAEAPGDSAPTVTNVPVPAPTQTPPSADEPPNPGETSGQPNQNPLSIEPQQTRSVQALTEGSFQSPVGGTQQDLQPEARTSVDTSPPPAYDRIHTTNVIDYIGPLNVLTGIGSRLKPDCRHVAIKTNVLLNLGLYLKPDSPTRVFELDHWLRRELLLSRGELREFLGYTVIVSSADLADPTYLVPTLGTEPPLAGSARLAEWLDKTLVNVTLPLVTEEPRRTPGRGCSVLEPRGHTISTFVNVLRHLVERRRAPAHWVAERTVSALQRPEPWRTDLAVALSLALSSLPFFPAPPALFPLSALVRHSLSIPLFPWAILPGKFTGNPQLALVVIVPERSDESVSADDVKFKRLTQASGERLRSMLTEVRSEVHLFSSLVVSKPDKRHVTKVEAWLPKKWVDEGTVMALLLRIDRYEFVSNFVELE